MIRNLTFIVLTCAMPHSVLGGAWPRAEGTTFLSFGSTVTSPIDALGSDLQTTFSLYLERGGKKDRTFGLDLHAYSTDRYTAIGFVRVPILRGSETHKFAFQLGAGAYTDAGTTQPLVQSGLSWGRGFKSKLGHGWASVDAQVQYLTTSGEVVTKADFTLGVSTGKKLKLMMQVQTGDYPASDPYVRLVPSATWALRPGRHIEFATQIGVVNDNRIGVRIGTWIEF